MEAKWTLREQLILASAVQKSGDQNWVSVTRAIKPLMEDKRSQDFFSQKNCAMQYAKMLDKANTPKRTKRSSRDSEGVGETAQDIIVRQLTEKRIIELDHLLEKIKEEYMTTMKEIEDLRNEKLTEKEMQLMLEEMAGTQKTAEDPFASAVQSPLGAEESKLNEGTMDTEPLGDASQGKLRAAVESNQPSTVLPLPPALSTKNTEQQEVMSPSTGSSLSQEVSSPLPVEQQKVSRPASLSPHTPSEMHTSSLQLRSPPPDQQSPWPDPSQRSPTAPISDMERTREENQCIPEPTDGDEGRYYASVAWCQKEHAYASKSTSPTLPIPPFMSGGGVPVAYTDATLVSKVKSMVIAMGNENVLVSDLKVTTTESKLDKPPQSLFSESGRQESQEVDKDGTEFDSKSEEEDEEEIEKMDATERKDEEEPSVVKVDEEKKTDEEENEAQISLQDETHEEDKDSTEKEDQPSSPKVEETLKDRPRSPEIDVESIASSPPARDQDDDTPTATPSTSKGSRKAKGKRKPTKKEVVEEQPKTEEKAKDKVTKESKAAKGKTRSSKRGGVKKEDSEPEDEETTMITPRRSGRVKATDKKDKQEDSEMEEPSAVNSAVSSPSPSLSDLGADQVQSHKAWKRAIMLVWRQIAQHKYANLFLQPVRDDDATGYSEVVHRPVDLSSIKKNIESGVTRSDIVFQRDILLMFQNALMYNSSDHDVYKMAEEMRSDSMEYIQDYLATQLMVQSTGKPTVRTRRAEAQEKADEEVGHKKGSRKPSTEESSQGSAKRKKL